MPKAPPTYDQFTRPPAEGMDFSDSPSRAKREFAEECDINRIMRQYTQTGELPVSIMGNYGDFSDAVDFHTAQNIVARADAQFSALPAEVRSKFENDPAKFLDFVHDEANLDECLELGFLNQEGERRVRARQEALKATEAGKTPPSPAKPSQAPSARTILVNIVRTDNIQKLQRISGCLLKGSGDMSPQLLRKSMATNAGKSFSSHSFAQVPRAEIPRSTFDRSHGLKTTFDEGYLVPIYLDEVLPGDTHQVNLTAFCRLNTLIKPIMDNVYLDFFFFFVPTRLVWVNWQEFCGEQANPGDSISFTIPTLTTPITVAEKSLGDYMGLPLYSAAANTPVSSLPFRCYNLIYNEWFRDQNLINSSSVPTGNGPDALSLFPLLKRGKRHDYFTGCLPQPQRGATPVSIPLGSSAPVRTQAAEVFTGTSPGLLARNAQGLGFFSSQQVMGTGNATGLLGIGTGTSTISVATGGWYPSNLIADLTSATAATINSLRLAFQTQRLLERDARGGTRYTEILRAHFGVVSPDFRLQRPEYLGGGQLPVSVNPVAQTTATGMTGGNTPLANLAGYSLAAGGGIGFSKSFVEHGYVLGLVSARCDLTYQQGLNRLWSRSTRYDFYWPAFANLGEQAVLQKEIYSDGSVNDANLFGYQERWAEYRYKPSQITGTFRSQAATPLDVWHAAQKFTAAPTLNQAFIEEPTGSTAPIYRLLAVPTESHFLYDSHLSVKSTRPMPVYSVPGMIDHFQDA